LHLLLSVTGRGEARCMALSVYLWRPVAGSWL